MMGLDSFWVLPEGADAPRFEPPLFLCGGMLSGHGEGSFRGKVYDHAVSAVAGVSLYQENIPNAVVRRVADALEAFVASLSREEEDGGDDLWPERRRLGGPRGPVPRNATLRRLHRPQEWRDLCRMFRAYADRGASLHGWW